MLCWPLREALLAYEHHLKAEAREEHFKACLFYTLRAPWTDKNSKEAPPKLPDILKE